MEEKTTTLSSTNSWSILKGILHRHNEEIVDLKKSVSDLESFKDVLISLLEESDIGSKEI